jgi:hypothetical protein
MTSIKLISLNVCNDDDLIYGTSQLSELDISKFIAYHNIQDKNIISDLEKLYKSQIKVILDNKVVVHSESGLNYLNPAIVSYYIDPNNELRSITINLGNKIRYINNLDPYVVDNFMTNKKQILMKSIIESNADFIFLQELNDHYVFTQDDLKHELINYNIVSPLNSAYAYNKMLVGMMGNYILYKKSQNILFVQSFLKDFGTVGEFKIDGNLIKIVSGRWYPLKQYSNIRLKQLEALDKEKGRIIFMGDTNLRYNENINTYNVYDGLVENKYPKHYTINKNINQYFNDDFKYIARYDRIYISDVDLIYCELYFNTIHEELKNTYRNSGFISDHFGLIAEVMI